MTKTGVRPKKSAIARISRINSVSNKEASCWARLQKCMARVPLSMAKMGDNNARCYQVEEPDRR